GFIKEVFVKIIEKFFKLKEYNTTISREIIAGFTTFLTMSYIIFVNPQILSDAGMNYNGVLAATVLVSAVSSILMGLLANLPFALAPGMGINAFFAYTLVIGQGISWQSALGAVFLSGIIFLILTLFKVRRTIVKAIPNTLRNAVAAGIGIFIAFIGLKEAGVIVANESTIVTMGGFNTGVYLFFTGLFITSILVIYKVRVALLAGIIITTVLGWLAGDVGSPSKIFCRPDFSSVFFKLDIKSVLTVSMIAPVFTFLFTDMFDSISTFLGVSQVADMLDDEGQPRNVGKALFVDALSTTVSGLFGSSSGTTYIESASGVEEGGRTGLTAVVVGLLFVPFLFLGESVKVIPRYATSPALVIVGVYMMSAIRDIDFKNIEEAIPAFLAIIMIPFTYSITQGIVWGFLTYTVFKVIRGKADQLHPMMYVIFLFSVLALIYG
ncbi:MAG: NCS2 family permease, partial [Elusimicrobiota bacterium]